MSHPVGGNGNNNRNYRDSNRPFVPMSKGRKVPFYWRYNTYRASERRSAPYWLLTSQLRKNVSRPQVYWPYYLGGVFLLVGLVTLMLVIVAPVIAGFVGYNYYDHAVSPLTDYSSVRFEITRIYDRNNQLIYEKLPSEGARDYILYKDIPRVLIDATTSAEDPTFFTNPGYDLYGIARALYINASGAGSSGASTITQQVARLIYLPPELRSQVTPDRKLRELVLAIKISQQFSKEQILEKYLNQIYYGDRNYGIEAAAQGYFGKKAKDLNLPEAAMLAGLPQAPSDYDPRTNYTLGRRRQELVLNLMVKNGKITQYQADQALNFDIKADLANGGHADVAVRCPHFVDYILAQLNGQIDSPQFQNDPIPFTPDEWNQGGYDVYTTIDANLEDKVEKVAQQHINDLQKQNASNAALVALKPQTGEILAMMGSVDYNNKKIDGQVNVATSERQPGSSIKPITYAVALAKGWTPATILSDVTQKFDSGEAGQAYVPHDFDNQQRGPVALRNALGSSLNIPAVETLKFDGVQNMMDQAALMGIRFHHTADFYGLPLTLGGGEVRLLDLTGAYSVFDNLGYRIPPVSILKITKHGRTVYNYNFDAAKKPRVLDSSVSYMITNILSDNNARLLAFAPNNPLVLDRPAAAKTGTTDNFRDSWTVGYTPDLVAGVWVGNDNNAPMNAVAGSIGGGQIWHDVMEEVYHSPDFMKDLGLPNQPLQTDFYRPSDIVEAKICADSGLLPNDACPPESVRTEIFAKGHVPTQVSTLEQRIRVVKGGYCLAGDDYPETAVEYRIIYNYPPELQDWAKQHGRPTVMPPVCQPYAPPTPVIIAPPSQTTGVDNSGTPGNNPPTSTPVVVIQPPGAPVPPTPTAAPPPSVKVSPPVPPTPH